jgi:hypothetical protein
MEMYLKQVDNPRKLVPLIRNCVFGFINVKTKNYNILESFASVGNKPFGEPITDVAIRESLAQVLTFVLVVQRCVKIFASTITRS